MDFVPDLYTTGWLLLLIVIGFVGSLAWLVTRGPRLR